MGHRDKTVSGGTTGINDTAAHGLRKIELD
jgi:hypothetical protein